MMITMMMSKLQMGLLHHAIHFQLEISANSLEIRAIQSKVYSLMCYRLYLIIGSRCFPVYFATYVITRMYYIGMFQLEVNYIHYVSFGV
jgi:hypothetical protein